jgi:hypothetical protein
MKRKAFFFFAFALICLPGWAQDVDSASAEPLPSYRIRSTVAGVPIQRDHFLSPLLFGGLVVGRNTGTVRYLPNSIRQHNFYSANGALLNWANNSILALISFGFDYTYHHQVFSTPDQKLRVYGGGGLNAMGHLKIHSGNVNNTIGYDIALPLEAGGVATYTFTLFNRRFMLTEQLSVPVVGLVVRPEYVWAVPFFIWEEEGRFRDFFTVSSWGNYVRLQNRLSLDYATSRKRKGKVVQTNNWRVTYVWDYYQINRPNQVKSATHLLMLGRMLNL